jgi:hypothetical protein
LVNALTELAWGSSTFVDAVLSLASLADAENETWANNSTGEFQSRYQVFLGGTAAGYVERLIAIDILLERPENSYWQLVINALAQVGRPQASRSSPGSRIDVAREPEWQPNTGAEHLSAIVAAVERLSRIARVGRPDLIVPLSKAVTRLRHLLRYRETRGVVADLMRALAVSYPEVRREFRQDLHELLEREEKRRTDLPPEDIAWLSAVFAEFQDTSPSGRLRELVGLRDYEFNESSLDPVAAELYASPSLLEGQWQWLTSGEALHAWELGASLARIDHKLAALPRLLESSPRGPDIRFIAGYLRGAAESRGQNWIDDLLDRWEQQLPAEMALVAELSWRSSPTDRSAARIAKFAESGRLPAALAAQLTFGGWCLSFSAPAFQGLLSSLAIRKEYRAAAVSLANQRLSKNPSEWPGLEEMVLPLLSDTTLFTRSDMAEYAWLELAKKLAPTHARIFASLLFAAHADKDSAWFLEHSQTAALLSMCVEADPAAVWDTMRPYLEDPSTALRFTIGFPGAVLERLPRDGILAWVNRSPEHRALFVARLIGKDLTPGSLGEQLLAQYPAMESLGREYFSAWVSGLWWGQASDHWERLSAQLTNVAKATSHASVAAWSVAAAASFKRMAAQERKREEEDAVRGH